MPHRDSDWRAAYAALLERAGGGDARWSEAARALGHQLRTSGVPVEDFVQAHIVLCEKASAGADDATHASRPCDAVLARVVRAFAEVDASGQRVPPAERALSRLFDRLPVGLYRTSPDGSILAANSTLVEMLAATSLEALLATNVLDYYARPAERGDFLAALDRNDVVYGFEIELRRRDGRALWVSVHAHAVRDADGRVIYFDGVLIDITERKRAEHELHLRWMQLESLVAERTHELQDAKDRAEHELNERRRAEEAERIGAARFRLIFDQSPIAAAIIGLDNRIERVNNAFCELLGYAESELTGRAADDFAPRDDGPAGLDSARRTHQRDIDQSGVELRYRCKDGRQIWVRASTRAINDPEGRPIHSLSLLQDVTGEKRAAEIVRMQRDLGEALLRATELPDALEAILCAALEIEGVDAGGVYVVSPTGGVIELITHRGLSAAFIAEAGKLAADSPQAEFVRAGVPLYVSASDSPFTPELLTSEGLRALAAIPVTYEGRAVACLNVASRTCDQFVMTARDALQTLATNAGRAIARMHDRDALQASERLFRTLANTIPALAVIIEGTQIVYINAAGAAMLGYAPGDVIGNALADFLAPESRDAILSLTRDRQLGRPVVDRYEVPVMARDGRTVWLDMSAARIDYQNRPAALGVALDISERRRNSEALRVLGERLEMAIQAADLGVFDWNVATGEVNYSDRWMAMLGYESGELPQHYTSWENALHPDEKERILKILAGHLEGRSPDYAVEMRLRTKSGDWKWVLASGKVVLRDSEGRALRMTGTHLDVSARKQAEELMRQHSEQFAHVSRVSTIGEMASALAHEMAQPLSAVLYYAQGATARIRQDATPAREICSILEKIANQAARAGDFIRQIKAFVRNARPTHIPSDANEAVRDAIALAEPFLSQKGVDLRLELARSLPLVVMDKIQIEQVILNLIRNAADAMDTLPRPDRRLQIQTLQAPEGHVRVGVYDTGPGIPTGVASRVFEPFFTTKQGGTGLGLSISRSIIEAHEGTLRIQSSERGGTVVWFTLPLAAEAGDDAP